MMQSELSVESLLNAATELVAGSAIMPALIAVFFTGLAVQLFIKKLKQTAGEDYGKSKNDWEIEAEKQIAWTLYYSGYELTPGQRALLRLPEDDEKPKRQTYMTIGDDGELVEMDE